MIAKRNAQTCHNELLGGRVLFGESILLFVCVEDIPIYKPTSSAITYREISGLFQTLFIFKIHASCDVLRANMCYLTNATNASRRIF